MHAYVRVYPRPRALARLQTRTRTDARMDTYARAKARTHTQNVPARACVQIGVCVSMQVMHVHMCMLARVRVFQRGGGSSD